VAPAGLGAAVLRGVRGLDLLVDRTATVGRRAEFPDENDLGFPDGVSGEQLANRASRQGEFGAANGNLTRDVVGLEVNGRPGRSVREGARLDEQP